MDNWSNKKLFWKLSKRKGLSTKFQQCPNLSDITQIQIAKILTKLKCTENKFWSSYFDFHTNSKLSRHGIWSEIEGNFSLKTPKQSSPSWRVKLWVKDGKIPAYVTPIKADVQPRGGQRAAGHSAAVRDLLSPDPAQSRGALAGERSTATQDQKRPTELKRSVGGLGIWAGPARSIGSLWSQRGWILKWKQTDPTKEIRKIFQTDYKYFQEENPPTFLWWSCDLPTDSVLV